MTDRTRLRRPPKASPGTQTVTIIDGTSGKRQEVIVPGSGDGTKAPPVDTKLLEISRHGPIPKIAADGARPAEAYARKTPATAGNADGPRIALIIGGLGVGASLTAEALSKIPGPVTFAFAPYGSDLESLVVARARRRPRNPAAGADGAVRLSRQRSRPADVARPRCRANRMSTACNG